MKRSVTVGCTVALFLAVLLPAAAYGLINPDFTPIHLTGESQLIAVLKAKAKDVGDTAVLGLAETLKGSCPDEVSIDLKTAMNAQHADAARKLLAASFGEPLLLFAGKYQQGTLGYLHVAGKWLKLRDGGEGKWRLDSLDDWMNGTWNGGTDMLLRCVRYVLAAGRDAVVPVTAGAEWADTAEVASLEGKVAAALAVDLAGDGKIVLHLAWPNGDRLYAYDAKQEKLVDVTAARKLEAKSRLAAWCDLNGDGRADLLSFDGTALTIHAQNADGTFAAAKAGGQFAIPAACRGLAVIGLGEKGTVGLVVSAEPAIVLRYDGAGGFAAVELPKPAKPLADAGAPQNPVAADFTNDGLPDFVLPFERNGLLYVGRADGSFAPPVACGVNCTKGGGAAAVGDLDGDGWMDVLTAGSEGVQVFHNLHDCTFAESLGLSGEVSYKSQPYANGCGVCDFNNDGRQDLYITYESQGPLLYFNRGWRSFGQSPKLEMALGEGITDVDRGQQQGVFADFDGDGAQDFVIITLCGGVYCAYNALGGDALAVRARLAAGAGTAGPVTLQAFEGARPIGGFLARPAAPPAFIGTAFPATFKLQYHLPGKPEQSLTVEVEDAPVDVVLKPAK